MVSIQKNVKMCFSVSHTKPTTLEYLNHSLIIVAQGEL